MGFAKAAVSWIFLQTGDWKSQCVTGLRWRCGRDLARGTLTVSMASHPRQRDTQTLLSPTHAMELRRRDYHVERPLLNQEELDEVGHWHPVKKTLQWKTWFQYVWGEGRTGTLAGLRKPVPMNCFLCFQVLACSSPSSSLPTPPHFNLAAPLFFA